MRHLYTVQRASSLLRSRLWSMFNHASIDRALTVTVLSVRVVCHQVRYNATVLHLQPFFCGRPPLLLIPRLAMHPPPPSRFSHCPGTTAATGSAVHRAPLASAAPAGPRRTISASTAMGGRLTRQNQNAPTAGMLQRNQVQRVCYFVVLCVYSQWQHCVQVLVTMSCAIYCSWVIHSVESTAVMI